MVPVYPYSYELKVFVIYQKNEAVLCNEFKALFFDMLEIGVLPYEDLIALY